MSRALKAILAATALGGLTAFVIAHAPDARAQDQAPAAAAPAGAAAPASAAAPADDMPPGTDRDLVQTTCTQCHASTQFSGLHKDAEGWNAIVTEMTGMGASIPDENVPRIVAYLAASFPPLPDAAAATPATPGEAAPATPGAAATPATPDAAAPPATPPAQ